MTTNPMTPPDPARLRRALEMAGSAETPLAPQDRQTLIDWYDHGDQVALRGVMELLRRVGRARVRIHGRLTNIAIVEGRDDLVEARWN